MNKIALLVMFMLLAGITNISAQSAEDMKKAEKIMSKIHPDHFNGSRGNICPNAHFLNKFLKAAELGHPFAQIKVAEIYYYGGYGQYLKDRPKSYEFFISTPASVNFSCMVGLFFVSFLMVRSSSLLLASRSWLSDA